MKIKKLIIISGIVIILLALAFAKNILQKSRSAKLSAPEPAIILMKEDPVISVAKVEVYNGIDRASRLILAKEPNGEWVIASKFGVKARKGPIENILINLKELRGDVRGESESLFDDFALLDNQAGHIILKDASDKALLHLIVSFKMTERNQSYARLADSQTILLLNRGVLSWFGMFDKSVKPQSAYFADYAVFAFDPNLVVKIDLLGDPKHSLVMLRDEGTASWRFEKPRRKNEIPDPGRVNNFLSVISGAQALDAVDSKLNSYGFDHPAKTIKLDLLKDKKTSQIQIDIGAPVKGKNAFYARVMPENKVYIFPDSFVNDLNKDKPSFIAKPVKAKKERRADQKL